MVAVFRWSSLRSSLVLGRASDGEANRCWSNVGPVFVPCWSGAGPMLAVREEKRLLADDGVAIRVSYSLVVRELG